MSPLFPLLVVAALNCGLTESQVVDERPIIYITNTNGVYQTDSSTYVIDCSKKYYFVTHGYKGTHFDPYSLDVVNKFNADPGNLAYFIDWVDISSDPIYQLLDTGEVGEALASQTLYPLYKQCENPYVFLHSVSTGVHMLGSAGRHLKALGYEADVIMGCDPSGGNITQTDAKQVVILHTSDLNARSLPIKGKVNFYFNGGAQQPGCPEFNDDNCNHERSMEYFYEALTNPYGFVGQPCNMSLGSIDFPASESQLTFNTDIPEDASGDYCITTNSQSPFAQGQTATISTVEALTITQAPQNTSTTTEAPSMDEDDEYHWIVEEPKNPTFICGIY